MKTNKKRFVSIGGRSVFGNRASRLGHFVVFVCFHASNRGGMVIMDILMRSFTSSGELNSFNPNPNLLARALREVGVFFVHVCFKCMNDSYD